MGDSQRQKAKLIARVRRIRGQVDGVERQVAEGRSCVEVLQLVAAVRGALNGLMGEVLGKYIQVDLLPEDRSQGQRHEAAVALIELVRAYLKQRDRL